MKTICTLNRVVEIVAACVLITSATLKASQSFGHVDSNYYGVIQNVNVTVLVIQGEILLGVWLLVGGFPRTRFIVAFLCFVLFAVVTCYEAFKAMPSCGCFGNVKVPPAIMAAFDVLAAAALYITRLQEKMRTGRPSFLFGVSGAVAVAVASVMLWIGYFHTVTLARAADQDFVVLEPDALIGRPLWLISEIDNGDRLRTGRWLLIFYHYDCDACLEAIPRYRVLAEERDGKKRLAFIAIPPMSRFDQDPVPNSANYLRMSLHRSHIWFATTPLVLAIENGIVIKAVDGNNAMRPKNVLPW